MAQTSLPSQVSMFRFTFTPFYISVSISCCLAFCYSLICLLPDPVQPPLGLSQRHRSYPPIPLPPFLPQWPMETAAAAATRATCWTTAPRVESGLFLPHVFILSSKYSQYVYIELVCDLTFMFDHWSSSCNFAITFLIFIQRENTTVPLLQVGRVQLIQLILQLQRACFSAWPVRPQQSGQHLLHELCTPGTYTHYSPNCMCLDGLHTAIS